MSIQDSITNTTSTTDSNGITTTSVRTVYNPDVKTVYTAAGIGSGIAAVFILPYVIVGGLGIYLVYRLTKK